MGGDNAANAMHTNEFLFPHRFSRRDFLRAGAALGVTTGLALPGFTPGALAAEKRPPQGEPPAPTGPVRMGSGKWTFTLDPEWGRLPKGMKYGLGCGIVIDGQERIYVVTRSQQPAVAVFTKKGELLETWGSSFAEGIGSNSELLTNASHGLYWSKEPGGEFLYFTENSAKQNREIFGRRVIKTDLKGKILFEIGNVQKEGSTAKKFAWDNPTDVAVAPNGDIYVVDGYGSQRVTRFDKDFNEIKTIGGRGKEEGQFNTCHGVWVATHHGAPEVYIADRHNNRIQVFDPELKFLRSLKADVRMPCCFYQHGENLFIPDLGSLVTILGPDDAALVHLGNGKRLDGITNMKDNQTNPAKFCTPHALTVDSEGSFYVVEWLPFGRVRKFRHTPEG